MPRGKVQEKGCSSVLQVWCYGVIRGFCQGTHISPSRQGCITPSLSEQTGGEIPVFSH